MIRALLLLISSASLAMGQLWKGDESPIDPLEQQAKSGDAAAMSEFAWHLIEGRGGRRFQPEVIFSWFEKSAAGGDPIGKVGLARCLTNGVGTDADFDRAWKLVNEALPHPEALKQKGYCLLKGIGTPVDQKGALKLTRQAAAGGSVAAITNMFVIDPTLREDMGNRIEGAKYARKTGDLQAVRNALYDYVFHRGDPARFEVAMDLIEIAKKSADLEHPTALLALAFVRECQGFYDEAVALRMRAATTGTRIGLAEVAEKMGLSSPNSPWKFQPSFKTRPLHERRLHWLAYRRGVRDNWLVSSVADGFLVQLDKRSPDPKRALAILRDRLPDPSKVIHLQFGQQYMRQMASLNRSEISADIALAHSIYACDKQKQAIGFIAYLLSGQMPGAEPDLAKAYAAARRKESAAAWPKAELEKLKSRLDSSQLAESEKLLAAGFPSAANFIEAARVSLEKAGDLGRPQP